MPQTQNNNKIHPVSKVSVQHTSIILEVVCYNRIGPTTKILQRLWEIEMVHRYLKWGWFAVSILAVHCSDPDSGILGSVPEYGDWSGRADYVVDELKLQHRSQKDVTTIDITPYISYAVTSSYIFYVFFCFLNLYERQLLEIFSVDEGFDLIDLEETGIQCKGK